MRFNYLSIFFACILHFCDSFENDNKPFLNEYSQYISRDISKVSITHTDLAQPMKNYSQKIQFESLSSEISDIKNYDNGDSIACKGINSNSNFIKECWNQNKEIISKDKDYLEIETGILHSYTLSTDGDVKNESISSSKFDSYGNIIESNTLRNVLSETNELITSSEHSTYNEKGKQYYINEYADGEINKNYCENFQCFSIKNGHEVLDSERREYFEGEVLVTEEKMFDLELIRIDKKLNENLLTIRINRSNGDDFYLFVNNYKNGLVSSEKTFIEGLLKEENIYYYEY